MNTYYIQTNLRSIMFSLQYLFYLLCLYILHGLLTSRVSAHSYNSNNRYGNIVEKKASPRHAEVRSVPVFCIIYNKLCSFHLRRIYRRNPRCPRLGDLWQHCLRETQRCFAGRLIQCLPCVRISINNISFRS